MCFSEEANCLPEADRARLLWDHAIREFRRGGSLPRVNPMGPGGYVICHRRRGLLHARCCRSMLDVVTMELACQGSLACALRGILARSSISAHLLLFEEELTPQNVGMPVTPRTLTTLTSLAMLKTLKISLKNLEMLRFCL